MMIPQPEFSQGVLFEQLEKFFGDKGVYLVKIGCFRPGRTFVFFN
jgi:hypothetical protein